MSKHFFYMEYKSKLFASFKNEYLIYLKIFEKEIFKKYNIKLYVHNQEKEILDYNYNNYIFVCDHIPEKFNSDDGENLILYYFNKTFEEIKKKIFAIIVDKILK